MYSLVQSKLACTLEPRKEANKSPEYGEVFGWSRLLLSLGDDDEGGKGRGGGYSPTPPTLALERMHILVYTENQVSRRRAGEKR